MQTETSCTQNYWDSTVLSRLRDPDLQAPASVDEIALEVGNRPEAEDAIGRLQRAGLVHRLDNFVWATRVALYAEQHQL
jgi:hypothetical protein